jgi:hypothetical protein
MARPARVATPVRVAEAVRVGREVARNVSTATPVAVAEPMNSISFDFNNNNFDYGVWTKSIKGQTNNGNKDIRVENGIMKVEKNSTSYDPPLLRSKNFDFAGNELVIQRKVLINNAGKYSMPNFCLYLDGFEIHLCYANYHYQAEQFDGIYFRSERENTFIALHPNNEYFREKIIINKSAGTLQYYLNDNLKKTLQLGNRLNGAKSFYLTFDAAAWYTGDKQYFDDLVIETR